MHRPATIIDRLEVLHRSALTAVESARTLTIGKRVGSFPGMLTERTFNVVLVSKTKGVGFSFTPVTDRTVHYRGEALVLRLP